MLRFVDISRKAVEGLRPAFSAHVRWCDPNFLHAVLDAAACAAFCEESRMKCSNATNLHRKFGGTWGTIWCCCYRLTLGELKGLIRLQGYALRLAWRKSNGYSF